MEDMLSITSPDFSIANQPNGITELTHRVYYSSELSGFLEEINGDLTFYGADYTFLRRAYLTNSCRIIPFELTDGCGLVLDCNMFLNECEWRPDLCQVKGQLVDGGFLSLIDQNMAIKAYVNVGRSKNDVDISSSVLEQTNLYYYGQNQQSGGGDIAAQNRVGVRVYDAFKMLVAFMTDGALGFESDFFRPDDLGRGYYTLITGNSLRTGDVNSWPLISFEELYTDCQRLFNLSFATETVGGVKRLRIEPTSFFRQTNSSITLADPDAVTQTSNEKSFYQKIEFGSNKFSDANFDYFPNATFLGFREEEFHLGGQCNTRNVLKLQTETLIYDTNRIQAALPVASGGAADPDNILDEDIYIVQHYSDNSVANTPNPLSPTVNVYFNEILSNYNIALRWGDGIPYPIYLFLGLAQNFATGVLTITNFLLAGIGVFRYVLGGDSTGFDLPLRQIVNCNDDTFPLGEDPNGNYTIQLATPESFNPAGTWPPPIALLGGRYTAPFDAVYVCKFEGITYIETLDPAQSVGFGIAFQVFNSFNVFQYEHYWFKTSQPNAVGFGLASNQWDVSVPLFMSTGDYVILTIFDPKDLSSENFGYDYTTVYILNGAKFIVEDPLGGQWATYDPNDNALINTAIKYPITSQTWQTYLNNRHGIISVPFNNGAIEGRTNDLSRNLHTGMTEVKIVSTFGQTEI